MAGGYGGVYTLNSVKYQRSNEISDFSRLNSQNTGRNGLVNRLVSKLWSNRKGGAISSVINNFLLF